MTTLSSLLLEKTYQHIEKRSDLFLISPYKFKLLQTIEICYIIDDVDSFSRILILEDKQKMTHPFIVNTLCCIFEHCMCSIHEQEISRRFVTLIIEFFYTHTRHIHWLPFLRICKSLVNKLYSKICCPIVYEYAVKNCVKTKALLSIQYFPNILTDIITGINVTLHGICMIKKTDSQAFSRSFVPFCIAFRRYDIIQITYDHGMVFENDKILMSHIGHIVKSAICIQRWWRDKRLKYWIARICYRRSIHPSIGYIIYKHGNCL